jgi:hypothetical protein
MPTESTSDLELVLAAATITYAIGRDDHLIFNVRNQHKKKSWLDAHQVIRDKGYRIDHMIAPKTLQGTSNAPLSALCLKPNDENAPIVIAFKGTKSSSSHDLYADAHIFARGVAPLYYREAAFDYYARIRKENPNRHIILSGHSLGGNLASDVGVRAYAQGEKNGFLSVRTFNSAPIKTNEPHVTLKKEQPATYDHFINYRIQHDPVSENSSSYSKDGVRYGRYGSMVTLRNPHASPHHAHHARIFKEVMPAILLKQKIGSQISLEQEKIIGIFETIRYECFKSIGQIKSNNPIDKVRLEQLIHSFEACKQSMTLALADNDLNTATVTLIDFIDHMDCKPKQKSLRNIISDAYGYKGISIHDPALGDMTFINYCIQFIQSVITQLSSCIHYLMAFCATKAKQPQPNDSDDPITQPGFKNT